MTGMWETAVAKTWGSTKLSATTADLSLQWAYGSDAICPVFSTRKTKEHRRWTIMWCDNLSQEEWDEKYDSTDEESFLHGECNIWLNQHYEKGDKCVALTEQRECGTSLMHCCLLRNGEYIDVRGNTDNIDDVIDAFDYGWYNIETYETLDDFNERMRELKVI
jgi:hypothetical protein